MMVDQTQRKVQIDAVDSERMERVMGIKICRGKREKIKCWEINHLKRTG